MRVSSWLGAARRRTSTLCSDPSCLGVSSSRGHRWPIKMETLLGPALSPSTLGHPDPREKGSTQGHTVSLGPGSVLPSLQWWSSCIRTHLQHPPHPVRLTLQLLVPSLPLKADGGCPIMDEALEAGILALLHSAAGRVDGDDRAPKTWWQRAGLDRAVWVPGSPRLPRPMASASLTVGGPRAGWDSDSEGGFLLGP